MLAYSLLYNTFILKEAQRSTVSSLVSSALYFTVIFKPVGEIPFHFEEPFFTYI